ncbi:FecR family protein [Pedobacter gandavensis]|uniref:FecR family protein n=1 Tax=Pedobacter TaxID=84567 RepID=UPI001C99625F|nr:MULTISPECIES: FecR family protein [Pedobacter]WGQ12242.1 FecR family protein [Pedobacter gandavensis]
MEKQEIENILDQFSKGIASAAEHQAFNEYLVGLDDDAYSALLSRYEKKLNDTLSYDLPDPELLDKIKDKALPKPVKRYRLKTIYRYAAAAIVLISLSVYLFTQQDSSPEKAVQYGAHQKYAINAPENKAVLTLANGKKISLTDAANGKIAEQSGIKITKTSDGQLIYDITGEQITHPSKGQKEDQSDYNSISTPAGGKYQINLPDGTKVWLNAMSSIKYAPQFMGKERSVILSGEAYFEVAKHQGMSFKVISRGQVVKVLGTHFNINAYQNEPAVKTTLAEGSVLVNMDSGSKKQSAASQYKTLVPGEQSILENDELNVKKVDLQEALAWKDGYISLDGELKTIMRNIERVYNVTVVYQGEIENVEIGGIVSKSRSLSEILNTLESLEQVRFKVEGRRITVMK